MLLRESVQSLRAKQGEMQLGNTSSGDMSRDIMSPGKSTDNSGDKPK